MSLAVTHGTKAIIVFVKPAIAGNVKTRLAATIGNEQALKVYLFLLAHTRELVRSAGYDLYIFYDGPPGENEDWGNGVVIAKVQQGGDLGAKMHHAFETVFADGYHQVMIIGSDCYELNTDIIRQSFEALATHDVVIGPAKDGGYYLLGQKGNNAALFRNKQWSTSTVFEDTVNDIRLSGNTLALMPVLSDVDEEKDIKFSYE